MVLFPSVSALDWCVSFVRLSHGRCRVLVCVAVVLSGEETVLEGSTARSFRGVLLQKLKNYSDANQGTSLSSTLSTSDTDPKIEKMRAVKAELDSLASSAKVNIDKVLSRGVAIESLVDRTGLLHSSGAAFKLRSKKLNQSLCMENVKLKLLMALVIFVWTHIIRHTRARTHARTLTDRPTNATNQTSIR